MAHQRSTSTMDGTKEPHSVSLKVLRLSRPSLSIQHPLPTPSPSPDIYSPLLAPHPFASLAYPSSTSAPSTTLDPFILSPILTLPPAFGSAYVGETFSCTLCANNELLLSSSSNGSGANPSSTAVGTTSKPSKKISNIAIEAEMKIPSSNTPVKLDLTSSSSPPTASPTSPPPKSSPPSPPPTKTTNPSTTTASPTPTIQRTLTFPLLEEGSHILAITVSYTETITTPTSISSRVRTFRKLYQFVCKACLVVRTKARGLNFSFPPSTPSSPSPLGEGNTGESSEGEPGMEPRKVSAGRKGGRGGKKAKKWLLEAQLENSCDETIILEGVVLECVPSVRSTSFNWERDPIVERPVLRPADVLQVGFLVEEVEVEVEVEVEDEQEEITEGEGGVERGGVGGDGEKKMQIVDGKWIFGTLSLSWRGAMGSRGVLSTGRLGAKVT